MHCFATTLVVSNLVFSAWAAKHHLFVGTFGPSAIYALEFDDEASTLVVTKNITAQSDHPWIALSKDKRNLYGAGTGGWTSYDIKSQNDLSISNFLPMTGNCSSQRGIFIIPSANKEGPSNVYGSPFGNCLNSMSLTKNGTLDSVIQNFQLTPSSGAHGMSFSKDQKFLYTADLKSNAIWTHLRDSVTGRLGSVGYVSGPSTGSGPRHLATHPNGTYVYAVLEEANQVSQLQVQPTRTLAAANAVFPLLPQDANTTNYWSDEVALSPDASILWATSRCRGSEPGYINAFSLASNGSIEYRLLQVPTTTSGGSANAIAPAPFSNDLVALTDASVGFVQIWRLSLPQLRGYPSLTMIAQANISDFSQDEQTGQTGPGGAGSKGCCANAVWLD